MYFGWIIYHTCSKNKSFLHCELSSEQLELHFEWGISYKLNTYMVFLQQLLLLSEINQMKYIPKELTY